jgi:DNA-binding transcriptional MocR family regulator
MARATKAACIAALVLSEQVHGFVGPAAPQQSRLLQNKQRSGSSLRCRQRCYARSLSAADEAASSAAAAATLCYDGACDYRDDAHMAPADESFDAPEVVTPAVDEPGSTASRPTVWSEFSALATETGGINLGQGFPNWDPPDFVIEAGIKAMTSGFNQYTRTAGHPRLVELLAGRYTKHFGREVDPYAQVAITIGASQALYITMQV